MCILPLDMFFFNFFFLINIQFETWIFLSGVRHVFWEVMNKKTVTLVALFFFSMVISNFMFFFSFLKPKFLTFQREKKKDGSKLDKAV